LAKRTQDVEAQADTLATLGTIPGLEQREWEKYLLESIELAESHGYLYIAMRAYNNLGFSAGLFLEDYNAAATYLFRAAAIARQRGEVEYELHILNNAATAALDLGDYPRAEDTLRVMEKRVGDLLDPHLSQYLPDTVKARLLAFKGDWLPALRLMRDVFSDAIRQGRIETLVYLGFFLVRLILEVDKFKGQIDLAEAEGVLEEIFPIDRGAVELWQALPLYGQQIAIYTRQGWFEQAHARLEEAHRLGYGTKDIKLGNWAEGSLLSGEVELAVAERSWEAGIRALEALVNLFTRLGKRWEQARAMLEWGDAYAIRREAGDLDRAQALYRQAMDLFTELGSSGYAEVAATRLQSAKSRS
jgi:hypothetical protein